ncbi:membrane hypothetical protein [metagenome]|uniref:ABC transmembrane type-1 domain-containing protein n=1 Tax=metagenome TaxID=256318 RepID=A0A2P2C903_9ZZZZ
MTSTSERVDDPPVTGPRRRSRQADSQRAARVVRWLPSSRGVLGLVVTLTVVYLVFGPLLIMLVAIFQNTERGLPLSENATWTLDNITSVYASGRTWDLLLTTLTFALGSLAVAGFLALALAWLTERTNLPFPRVFFVLIVASAGVPGLVSTIAWGVLLNPAAGPISDFTTWAFGWAFNPWSLLGMVLVQGLHLIPVMYLLISATFKGLNPALEEAASASGATTWMTMRRITLPLLTPAIVGAFIYSFVATVDSVDVPLIFGLPGDVDVLAIRVWLEADPAGGIPQYGLSSSYGLLLIAMSLIPLVAYNRIIRKSSRYATVTGKGYRPRRLSLGAWRWPAFVLMGAVLLMQLILPMLMLFWASIQPFYGGINQDAFDRINFDAWRNELLSPFVHDVLITTLKVGLLAGLGTIVLTALGSWYVVRSRTRLAGWLDFLMFFPHMLPGIVIGLAVLLVYLILPIGVYGTMWILVIAFVMKNMPLASRVTTPGVAQISVTLEEAASVSGGSLRHVLFRVLLPLLKGVLANGYLLVFMGAIQNLSLPLMLNSVGNEMISTQLLTKYDSGQAKSMAVLSLVLVLMTTILATVVKVFDKQKAS